VQGSLISLPLGYAVPIQPLPKTDTGRSCSMPLINIRPLTNDIVSPGKPATQSAEIFAGGIESNTTASHLLGELLLYVLRSAMKNTLASIVKMRDQRIRRNFCSAIIVADQIPSYNHVGANMPTTGSHPPIGIATQSLRTLVAPTMNSRSPTRSTKQTLNP